MSADLSALPKVHLHVHLESTLRWQTLRELGDSSGVAVPAEPADPLAFNGFAQFADYNTLIRECLRRPADFTRVAREFCVDEAAQGTRYVEVTFTAAAHGERLGEPDMPLVAVLEGLRQGQRETGLEYRVLLDQSRRRSVDRAWQTLRLAREHDEVAGIGAAGDEAHPVAPFAEVWDAARESGVHLIHHAGETRGPDSIREALELGHAERIGHGIRVLDDAELVATLRDKAIPLEVCPSSNVALGLVPSLGAHPLPRLIDAGLAITLNTDIPGSSLTGEFTKARTVFGLSDSDVAALNHIAIDASLAPSATKAVLHRETDTWLRGNLS